MHLTFYYVSSQASKVDVSAAQAHRAHSAEMLSSSQACLGERTGGFSNHQMNSASLVHSQAAVAANASQLNQHSAKPNPLSLSIH